MRIQRARLSELFLADSTLVGLFSSMDFHMIRERSSLSKTFIAICTSIGLFTCVNFQVV